MILLYEILPFADHMYDDLNIYVSFSNCKIKKSAPTVIKICNINFELGLFTKSTLQNYTFRSKHFQKLKCKKCVFENC